MQGRLSRVEAICGHHFDDQDLVAAAVTHPSAAEGKGVAASYERLEFLGDAILGAVVSKHLFERFDGMNEGELTRLKISLSSGSTLSQVSEELGLEDVYEALVAALFLDGGEEACASFIERTLFVHVDPELAERPLDTKSKLQQYTQHTLHCAPEYQLIDRTGPAHCPVFVSAVFVNGEKVGTGEGRSKKESESIAAEQALIYFGCLPAPDGDADASESDFGQDEKGAAPCI